MVEKSSKVKKVTVKSIRTEQDVAYRSGTADSKKSRGNLNGSGDKAEHTRGGISPKYASSNNTQVLQSSGKHPRTKRCIFLQGLAFIYFIAFLSVYLQIEGLYGSNGVTPIKAMLKLNSRTPTECFKDTKSLICALAPELGITSQHTMEFIALIGIILSGIGSLCVNCCVAPLMLILWIAYFSLYQVGGVFLWFQWDILLLETGILGILAAPWFPNKSSFASKPRDVTTMWMVKWLLFRLMFASGVVKLMSGCPTWWNLSALNYHFESQCLPTPVAYYFHQLPQWILRLLVIGTYYIEIILPFGFFIPSTGIRRFCFWSQVIFQLTIILTGNYNFFNLLTILLCVSLLDTTSIFKSKQQDQPFSFSRIFSTSIFYIMILFSLYFVVLKFNIKFNPDFDSLDSKTGFNRVEFDWFIAAVMPYALGVGLLTLTSAISQSIFISVIEIRGFWSKVKAFISAAIYGAICLALFGVTLVPFTILHKESNNALWTPLKEIHGNLSQFHVTSSYGLFRRMTGVEKGRPEVILQYSDNLNGPWKEFNFLYKPGDVSAAPKFLLPHQPRLDWQLWFAALGTYHDNPWLVSLTYRLLQGEASVLKLLDVKSNPTTTPKFIRASLYHYSYTKLSSAPKDWWTRGKPEEYLPTFSVDHLPLVDFITKLGYLDQDLPAKSLWNTNLSHGLDVIRRFLQQYSPEYVIWGLLASFLLLIFTSRIFF